MNVRDIRFPKEASIVLLNQSAGANFIREYEAKGVHVAEELLTNERFREDYFELYRNGLAEYVNSLSGHIPDRQQVILDIGCGLGMVPLLICRSSGFDHELHLLDRSVPLGDATRAHGGYHPEGYVFTASLHLTREFLEMNGVPPHRIHTIEASESGLSHLKDIDLVLSRNSWGFHYPIETYFDEVRRRLSADGRVILDVRKGTGALDLFEKNYETVRIIAEGAKSLRIVAARPISSST